MTALSTPGAVHGTTSYSDADGWWHRAACKDADSALFFPPDGERGAAAREREAKAKAICATCPVRRTCLMEALDNTEAGIWGGTNEEERRGAPTGVCGQPSGWNRHKRLGERQCAICLAYERNRQEAVALRHWVNVKPLIEQGLTREEVAERLGVNFHTVRKAHQAGLRAERRGDQAQVIPIRDNLVAEVEHLAGYGHDLERAAAAVKKSAAALERALLRRGQHQLVARLKRAA